MSQGGIHEPPISIDDITTKKTTDGGGVIVSFDRTKAAKSFRNPYSLTARSFYHGWSNRESRYTGCQRGRPQGIQRGSKKKHQASGRGFG